VFTCRCGGGNADWDAGRDALLELDKQQRLEAM